MFIPRSGLTMLAVALCAHASAGPVDDEVAKFRLYFGTPGISVAVVKEGKVIFAKGYGLANVEGHVKASADTVYRIGSVSKQFLAAGIMLLEQEGKLSVDDKLSKYLEGTPPEWSGITLRHLLTHTSGLTRECPAFNAFEEVPLIDQIKSMYTVKLDYPTGTKYQYSNAGYFILAQVIEKASGKPWGDFIADRIFKPLGMGQSGLCDEWSIIPTRARGYEFSGPTLYNAIPFVAMRPSGAFMSTALDMAKWDAALYGDSILSGASKAKMWSPATLADGTKHDYGFAWVMTSVNGHRLITHNGAQPGFRSDIGRYVDDKVTVIALANEDGTAAEKLTSNIARHYISGLAASYKEIQKPEADKLGLVERYIRSHDGAKPDTSLVTSVFLDRVEWPAEKACLARIGALVSLTALEPGAMTGPYTHRYLAKFNRMNLMVTAAFRDGKLDRASFAID